MREEEQGGREGGLRGKSGKEKDRDEEGREGEIGRDKRKSRKTAAAFPSTPQNQMYKIKKKTFDKNINLEKPPNFFCFKVFTLT